MVVSALAVGLIYVWGRLALGRRAGLVAALAFALLPRVFFHAHLACFDVPVAALWLATAFALWRASERRRASWIVATGVLYGLFLDTKHNAWLFPLVVLAVVLLDGLDAWLAAARSRRLPVPWVLGSVLVLGPLVLYLGWPWLWYDPLPRLADWVHFHTHHDYYNMEFLGRTYWRPPMPRGYAWVMTAATVPGITLVLAVLGIGAATHREVISRWRAARGRPAASGSPPGTGALVQGRTTVAIWLASIAVAYAPWWSADTPIFGGTKHWLGAYPFLCLFVGAGFEAVARRLEGARRAGWAWIPLALAVLAGPAVMTASSHPWGLTFYTPLVGGAPGAATLGLNRTFWGYTTGAVQDELNRLAPPEGRVYLHDTAMQSYALEHGDGRLRPDLGATLDIARSTIALYHHEPHMRRVEHQIWVDYGTVSPAAVGAYDGVPVVWIYVRPP
jgi:4-amino-4-deoxy-L-arabinose transferase-like glycosyltransferase